MDSPLLWTLPLQPGLQKRIQGELVAKRRTAAMTSLPTGEPRNGLGTIPQNTRGCQVESHISYIYAFGNYTVLAR